jgi:hypothetical protein
MNINELVAIIHDNDRTVDPYDLVFPDIAQGAYGYVSMVIFYRNKVYKIYNGFHKTEDKGMSRELAQEYLSESIEYRRLIQQCGVLVPRENEIKVIPLHGDKFGILEIQERIDGETMLYRLQHNIKPVDSFLAILGIVHKMKPEIGTSLGFDIQFGNFVFDKNDSCFFVDFIAPRLKGGLEYQKAVVKGDLFKVRLQENRFFSYLGVIFFLHAIYAANSPSHAGEMRELIVQQLRNENMYDDYRDFIQKPELHEELEYYLDAQRKGGIPVHLDKHVEELIFNF